MASPDILEDLLLLGVLDDKAVFGSMNRGGLQGAAWEIDDRFTAYDAAAIAAAGFEGGKMLVRIDPEDPATAATLEACAHAVSASPPASSSRWSSRSWPGGRRPGRADPAAGRRDPRVGRRRRARHDVGLHLAEGAGVDDMERVIGATTLPTLLLGGEVAPTRRRRSRAGAGVRVAGGDRPRRRPVAAVPARRRRRRGGRRRGRADPARGGGVARAVRARRPPAGHRARACPRGLRRGGGRPRR